MFVSRVYVIAIGKCICVLLVDMLEYSQLLAARSKLKTRLQCMQGYTVCVCTVV